MKHIFVKLLHRCKFHETSEVHDADLVADMTDHREIMADKQIGIAVLALEILENIDHLCLNRDIQSRDRLITHNKFRMCHQCTGDADTLSLSTGKLMWIPVIVIRLEPDHIHRFAHLFLCFCAACKMQRVQRLRDDCTNGFARIEAGHRILKNHLHFGPVWMQTLFIQPADILPMKQNLTLRSGIDQP